MLATLISHSQLRRPSPQAVQMTLKTPLFSGGQPPNSDILALPLNPQARHFIEASTLHHLIKRPCLPAADISHLIMALTRSFTFPLSHLQESSRIPPFALNHEDAGRLLSCRAFQAIRGFLTRRRHDRSALPPFSCRSNRSCSLTIPTLVSACTTSQPAQHTRKHGSCSATSLTL